jgi:alkyl hydroperoxide reductase subunit AhpC
LLQIYSRNNNGEINFHEWIGDSCVLFSHPADFTPVCTTELGTAHYFPEFEKRNTKVIALVWMD